MLIREARDAERAACSWMQVHGFPDARLTAAGRDGGVDVSASGAVAQVKAEVAPVGAPIVQQLAGIAAVDGRTGMVFSLGGFTPAATEFAERAKIALFRFDLQGDVEPSNASARLVAAAGADGDEVVQRMLGAVRRLTTLAERADIVGVIRRPVPRAKVGLRAYLPRVAVWTDQYLDHVAERQDGGEIPGALAMDLAGSSWRISELRLCADGYDEDGWNVAIAVEGQLFSQSSPIDGLEDGIVTLPTSNRSLVVCVVVGLILEIAERLGARPEHLRVTEAPQHDDATPDATPEALIGAADASDWDHLVSVVRSQRLTALRLEEVRWRNVWLELDRRGDRVVVRAMAGTMWDRDTPGPEALRTALKDRLPGIRVQCPTGPRPIWMTGEEQVESVVVRFGVPVDDVPLAVAVLAEALTLDADMVRVD